MDFLSILSIHLSINNSALNSFLIIITDYWKGLRNSTISGTKKSLCLYISCITMELNIYNQHNYMYNTCTFALNETKYIEYFRSLVSNQIGREGRGIKCLIVHSTSKITKLKPTHAHAL